MWYVSRQDYSSLGERANVVEIAGGGRDYSNPGQLVSKYPGEGEEYTDPRDAVTAAINILKRWEAASGTRVTIRIGHTGGNTIPFDAPSHGKGIIEAKKWANEKWEEMPKCPQCGEALPPEKEQYHLQDRTDEKFCSENCANNRAAPVD